MMTETEKAKTRLDMDKISVIAKRAWKDSNIRNSYADFMSLFMDIDIVHSKISKLDLDGLMEADDGNFFHDITGIRDNLNRETFVLENFFSPRYTKH